MLSMEVSLQSIPSSLTNEERLIAGCVRGERLYQRQLYEAYYSKMLSICMRYANDHDSATAMLNEGFLKVFTNLCNYRPTHPLETWIRRIMINTAIDHYRQYKKHQQQIDIEQVVHESDPHAENAIAKMSADEIMALVQQLSPAYRTVFNLYAIEGYSHREISDLLGINEGTSKSNLAKAKNRLQELIKLHYPHFCY